MRDIITEENTNQRSHLFIINSYVPEQRIAFIYLSLTQSVEMCSYTPPQLLHRQQNADIALWWWCYVVIFFTLTDSYPVHPGSTEHFVRADECTLTTQTWYIHKCMHYCGFTLLKRIGEGKGVNRQYLLHIGSLCHPRSGKRSAFKARNNYSFLLNRKRLDPPVEKKFDEY